MKLDKTNHWNGANEILDTISNPKLLKKLIAVKTLPQEKRINAAKQYLTQSVFENAKIKMPEGVRISSQYYEEQALLDADGRSSALNGRHHLGFSEWWFR